MCTHGTDSCVHEFGCRRRDNAFFLVLDAFLVVGQRVRRPAAGPGTRKALHRRLERGGELSRWRGAGWNGAEMCEEREGLGHRVFRFRITVGSRRSEHVLLSWLQGLVQHITCVQRS